MERKTPKKTNKKSQRYRPYPAVNPKRRSQPSQVISIPYGSAAMARQIPSFGFSYRATLRYHDEVNLGTCSATPASYVMAANGLYDPDITGTGHQPMGFDQLMAFFQHYCVLSSNIRVQFRCGDTTQLFRCAVAVNRGTSALTSWNRLVETGDTVYGANASLPINSGPIPIWYCNRVNIADFQHVANMLDQDDLRGTASANPATAISYTLYTAGDASTASVTLASVTIEYDAMFTEPLQVAQS